MLGQVCDPCSDHELIEPVAEEEVLCQRLGALRRPSQGQQAGPNQSSACWDGQQQVLET